MENDLIFEKEFLVLIKKKRFKATVKLNQDQIQIVTNKNIIRYFEKQMEESFSNSIYVSGYKYVKPFQLLHLNGDSNDFEIKQLFRKF